MKCKTMQLSGGGDLCLSEAPLRRLIIKETGTAILRAGPLDVRKPHQLDALHLAPGQRNALIRSGFSTLADVRFGVEHHVLLLVRNISKQSAHTIAERIRGHSGRRGSAAP